MGLRRQGVVVDRDRVVRRMRVMGLAGATRAKKRFTTRADPAATRAPDLVHHDFTADRPDAPCRRLHLPDSRGAFYEEKKGGRYVEEIRLEDVLDRLFPLPSDIRSAMRTYLANLFPGRRGTGMHTQAQVEMFTSLEQALGASKIVTASTHALHRHLHYLTLPCAPSRAGR